MSVEHIMVGGSWATLGGVILSLHRTTRVPDHEDPAEQLVTKPPSVSLPFSGPCRLTQLSFDGRAAEYLAALECEPGHILETLDAVALRVQCAGVNGGVKAKIKAEGVNVVTPPVIANRPGEGQEENGNPQTGGSQDYFVLDHDNNSLWVHGITVKENPKRLTRQFVVRNGDNGASISAQATGSTSAENMGVFEVNLTFGPRIDTMDTHPKPPRPPLQGSSFTIRVRTGLIKKFNLTYESDDEKDGRCLYTLKDFDLTDVYASDTTICLKSMITEHISLLMSRLVEFGDEMDPRTPQQVFECGPSLHALRIIGQGKQFEDDRSLGSYGIAEVRITHKETQSFNLTLCWDGVLTAISPKNTEVFLGLRFGGGGGPEGLAEGSNEVKIVPGGLIEEPSLVKDPALYSWNFQKRETIKIRVVNFKQFQQLTNKTPPTPPSLPARPHVQDSWTQPVKDAIDGPFQSNAQYAQLGGSNEDDAPQRIEVDESETDNNKDASKIPRHGLRLRMVSWWRRRKGKKMSDSEDS